VGGLANLKLYLLAFTSLRRIQQCCSTKDVLEKYVGQILKLSKLRNLQTLAKQTISAMPIHYDVTTDILFLEGQARGVNTGKAEGRAQGKVDGINQTKLVFKALQQGQTPEAIATHYNLPLATVLDLKATFGL